MKFEHITDYLFFVVALQTLFSRVIPGLYFYEFPIIKNYFLGKKNSSSTLNTVVESKLNIFIIFSTTLFFIACVLFHVGVEFTLQILNFPKFLSNETIHSISLYFVPLELFYARGELFLSYEFKYVGLFLWEIGALLLLWTHLFLGFSFSPVIDAKEAKLITDGPFKYIRHPMYLSIFLLVNGAWITISNAFPLFFGNLLFIFIWILRLNSEEECLVLKFGEKYKKYQKTTKRIFPFVY
jgi:protein-S-isoprenylcysteine O-methyltransferase Ste14